MKILDTKEYVSVLKELVEEGKEAGMKVAGNSMSPFLAHERDYICFSKPKRALKKGDMVRLNVKKRGVFIFDSETGERIK